MKYAETRALIGLALVGLVLLALNLGWITP